MFGSNSSNSSILKQQVNSSSIFSSFFSVIGHNSSVNFSARIFYFGQKDPIKFPILTLSGVLVKIVKFLMSFPKPPVSFSSNFANSSMSWKITPLYFFRSIVIYFAQGTNQSANFWDVWVLRSKFTKLLSFFKQQVSFSSNYVSLFSVLRSNSSALFELNFYILSAKGAYQKYKFNEILKI